MNLEDITIKDNNTEVKKSKVVNSDITGKKVDTKFKKGKDPRRNYDGRPKGSISLLTDIKKRLKKLAKTDPKEYQALIDYYWKEPKMRDLLIRMIDGNPKTTVGGDKDNPINIKYDWGEYKDNLPTKNLE